MFVIEISFGIRGPNTTVNHVGDQKVSLAVFLLLNEYNYSFTVYNKKSS